VDIRPIIKSDLYAVARVHMLAFPDGALTQLGVEAVQRYYLYQQQGPHDSYCIGVFTENRIAGFCVAGVFRGAEIGFLKRNRVFIILRLITHPWLLSNKIVLDRIRYSFKALIRYTGKNKSEAASQKSSATKFGILSIAVHPDLQGQGVGKRLMEDVEKVASQKGFKSIRLTVHIANQQAISFYENQGWQKVIAADEIWRGIMAKQLGG
jgi:ribosomal protein S18 acetylase RimI-like enzyme